MAPTPITDHLDATLRLVTARGLGPNTIARLRAILGSDDRVVSSPPRVLAAALDRPIEAGLAVAAAFARTDPWPERRRLRRLGVQLLTPGSPGWPPLLQGLDPPPPALWVQGAVPDSRTVAIVGSRRCRDTAIRRTEALAHAVAAAGWSVVSGGALGVDAAAHRGALRAGQPTAAVLGSGIAQAGPAANRPLFAEIREAGGGLVSEWPVDTPPRPGRFPQRNRTIAGLARVVIVTAAGVRSGAAITARLAAEACGRDVGVVPGAPEDPDHAGCLALARDGATVVRDADDVLELLGAAWPPEASGGIHDPVPADGPGDGDRS